MILSYERVLISLLWCGRCCYSCCFLHVRIPLKSMSCMYTSFVLDFLSAERTNIPNVFFFTRKPHCLFLNSVKFPKHIRVQAAEKRRFCSITQEKEVCWYLLFVMLPSINWYSALGRISVWRNFPPSV